MSDEAVVEALKRAADWFAYRLAGSALGGSTRERLTDCVEALEGAGVDWKPEIWDKLEISDVKEKP